MAFFYQGERLTAGLGLVTLSAYGAMLAYHLRVASAPETSDIAFAVSTFLAYPLWITLLLLLLLDKPKAIEVPLVVGNLFMYSVTIATACVAIIAQRGIPLTALNCYPYALLSTQCCCVVATTVYCRYYRQRRTEPVLDLRYEQL